MRAIDIERLETLARGSEPLLAILERAPQWLAVETVRNATDRTLHAERDAWTAAYVNGWRTRMGLTPCNDARRAVRAVEGWRWPRKAPPGSMVALNLGSAPFASESEWANAVRCARDWKQWRRRAQRVGEAQARKEMRAHAGDPHARVRARIAAKAKQWMKTQGTPHTLAYMRAQWAASPALAGDGTIAAPTLEESHLGEFEWAVPITGPEALAALVAWLEPWLPKTTPINAYNDWGWTCVTLTDARGRGRRRHWTQGQVRSRAETRASERERAALETLFGDNA